LPLQFKPLQSLYLLFFLKIRKVTSNSTTQMISLYSLSIRFRPCLVCKFFQPDE
jgi:hypothetical protein